MEKEKFNLLKWVKQEFKTSVILLRSIPSPVVALFVVSVITMNLLANKTIYENGWLAIDGGILVSWLSFMCMDIVTKHFGPKVATKLAIFAMCVNLLACVIFFAASKIGTMEGFDEIFGGTWFILMDSTIAFILSSLVNNFSNWSIGKMFKKNPDGPGAFFVRTYVSTFVGQFVDNLIFAVPTFMLFMPLLHPEWGVEWSFIQCVTCSLTGAAVELLCEVVFSPIGYKVTSVWKREEVGKDYFNYMKKLEETCES